MLFPVVLFLAGCVSLTTAAREEQLPGNDGCAVSMAYVPTNSTGYQPLLLKKSKGKTEFLYPEDQEPILRMQRGASVYLACPGPYNYLQYSKGRGPREVQATCVRKELFMVDRVIREFSAMNCRYVPQHRTRRTGKPCLGKYTTVEIGFQLNSTFLGTMEVCWEDRSYAARYTKFRMTKAIESYQRRYPRPSRWWVGDFYPGLDVEKMYQIETQLDTVARILNSTEIAKTRIKKSVQYMSRGHLTAKADFVYGAQQRATFWYINAAPQWQSFNGGNWNTLEDNVRRFAAARGLDLDVYTGVHEQMTMEDARRRQQPIHLHYRDGKRHLPVPRFYWKVIYDPVSKTGTAFVGLNDPFIERITESVYICDDISQRIRWLTWKPRDIKLGVSYACTVADLRKAVRDVPSFNVVGVLA